MSKEVRVRFAPSPTGGLHVGGLRTALFNYLFARHHGGKMILRIEDTDRKRFVTKAESYINETLAWAGIEIDEGPKEGGKFGPYRQSERKEIYQKYARQLVDEGKAYYAFDTTEELEELKEKLKAAKVANQTYNSVTRNKMTNSLTLSEKEVKQRLNSGLPYTIRLKIPSKEEIRFNDRIRGWIMVHSATIDDKIIMKSDGLPTYHLANIVDDHLMKITHVIRGEEWLPSAPLHVLLYQFLGWEDSMPEFAHLPLILKPSGQGKLSKRDAVKNGFPIFPLTWKDDENGEILIGYREAGYLPNALVNFLAFYGWNPGNEQEILNNKELIGAFDLERVSKAGTKFDIVKAQWYNQQYIKMLSNDELESMIKPLMEDTAPEFTGKAEKIVKLMRERITFPHEIITETDYLYRAPETFDEKIVKKKWTPEAVAILKAFRDAMKLMSDFSAGTVKELFQNLLESGDIGFGRVMPALRVAITGLSSGPDLMEIIEIIGQETAISRIDNALEQLSDSIKLS